ncbi:hypothetical protein AB1I63_04905 [Streptococcus pneumoniae]
MKLSILLLGVLACVFAIQPLSSDEQITQVGNPHRHAQEISNRTVREFALFCEETDTTVQEILELEYFPRDGQRFVTLGKHEPHKIPVLAFSSLRNKGIVASLDEETYDTSDEANSCTYEELKEQLLAWDQER